jgi:hypothetical protein
VAGEILHLDARGVTQAGDVTRRGRLVELVTWSALRAAR